MGATDKALQVATSQSDKMMGIDVSNNGFDVAASAVAAQAQAMVQSRYIMALRNPRNMDVVRQDLIAECKRPSFANNPSAFYRKPIGQGVEGLGIRFVEVALRCMKNVLIETKMVYENDMVEVHNVAVTDLESNITYPQDVKVTKTVERSKPNDDNSYISVRMNSYGKPVYTLPAQDDDLLNKRGALISKAIRTLGLRIIPGDLQDEAEQLIKQVRKNAAAADPDAERKRIVDAFAEMGVKASDLTLYLGHDLGQCTPAQLVDLRGIFGALRDGETTWKGIMANKAEQEAKPKDGEPQAEKEKSATVKAKDAAAAEANKEVKTEQPAQQAASNTDNATQATQQPQATKAADALKKKPANDTQPGSDQYSLE